jgi:lipopolysaccharide export system protein LptC
MSQPADSLATSGLTPRREIRPGTAYSRFVTAMKLLLPAVAIGLVMLVAIWPRLQFSLEQMRPSRPRLDLSEARDLRMVTAHYSGIDKHHRPYVLTAEVARQTTQQNDLISLEGPKADLTMINGAWLTLSGDTGVYLSQGQLLDLFGNVKLFHDRGYELSTETAHVDMAAGAAEGHDAVQGQGVFGDVVSEGFRLIDHGQVIVFTGKATLHLAPRPIVEVQ